MTLAMPASMLADPMIPLTHRIERIVNETHDTFTMEIQSEEGYRFHAGQFNMLYVFGVGEVPISISSDPGSPRLIRHTTREVGIVTRAMRRLGVGDSIGIRGPFGSPWPIDAAVGMDVVLVAGGIGLAPLRPALYRLLDEADQFGRVVLLYGTRTPADILFKAELERWRGKRGMEVHVSVDRAMKEWRGHVGVVTSLIPRAPFDPSRTVALVCGPEIMMRYTVMELQRRGIPSERIYVSLERNMKCAVGYCGHCQFGPWFVCRDGPVFSVDRIEGILGRQEI